MSNTKSHFAASFLRHIPQFKKQPPFHNLTSKQFIFLVFTHVIHFALSNPYTIVGK